MPPQWRISSAFLSRHRYLFPNCPLQRPLKHLLPPTCSSIPITPNRSCISPLAVKPKDSFRLGGHVALCFVLNNCRSVLNKRSHVKRFVTFAYADAISINEFWLNDYTPESLTFHVGYQSFRSSRKELCGGGCSVYLVRVSQPPSRSSPHLN